MALDSRIIVAYWKKAVRDDSAEARNARTLRESSRVVRIIFMIDGRFTVKMGFLLHYLISTVKQMPTSPWTSNSGYCCRTIQIKNNLEVEFARKEQIAIEIGTRQNGFLDAFVLPGRVKRWRQGPGRAGTSRGERKTQHHACLSPQQTTDQATAYRARTVQVPDSVTKPPPSRATRQSTTRSLQKFVRRLRKSVSHSVIEVLTTLAILNARLICSKTLRHRQRDR
eukprot:scaffold112153_cov35-Prasinocladus_malaysianus.AAC.2